MIVGTIPGSGWAGRAQPCWNSGLKPRAGRSFCFPGIHASGGNCAAEGAATCRWCQRREQELSAAELLLWGSTGVALGSEGKWEGICPESVPEGSCQISFPFCLFRSEQGTPWVTSSNLSPSVILFWLFHEHLPRFRISLETFSLISQSQCSTQAKNP